MSVANILTPVTDHLHALFKAPGRPANGALLQGDCLDIMTRFPAASFRGIITSPPYNLRNSSGNGLHDGRGGKWENAALLKGYSTHMDSMPHDTYVRWQRDCLDQMMRLLRPDGVIYMIAKPDFVLAPGANRLGCVWRISQQMNTPHPALFPPELVQNCLTAIGDGPVLDPFVGSGTTGMVATERGVDWVGIDISEPYLNTAAQRIAAAQRGEI